MKEGERLSVEKDISVRESAGLEKGMAASEGGKGVFSMSLINCRGGKERFASSRIAGWNWSVQSRSRLNIRFGGNIA